MTYKFVSWAGWAALALGASTAGVIFAQTAEPVPAPETTAATEGESADAGEPEFPELLPGYYNQTFTVRALDIGIPGKWGGQMGRTLNMPPVTERFCHTNEDLQRASEYLWSGPGGGGGCELVAASLEGTHGQGEFLCGTGAMRMVMRYSGEFTDTSAHITVIGEIRTKSREGAMRFKFDISMERFAETCTEDVEATADGEVAAPAVLPRELQVELKKQ